MVEHALWKFLFSEASTGTRSNHTGISFKHDKINLHSMFDLEFRNIRLITKPTKVKEIGESTRLYL